jgi:hypothetical protein
MRWWPTILQVPIANQQNIHLRSDIDALLFDRDGRSHPYDPYDLDAGIRRCSCFSCGPALSIITTSILE